MDDAFKALEKYDRELSGRYYNIAGEPIVFSQWVRRFEDRSYQSVMATRKRGILVSTVWLGLNHNFSHEGPPIIFETMIFGGRFDDGEWQTRCSTLEGALKMHEWACEVAFGWRSRWRELLWAWTPEIPLPPVWRWKPPRSWAKPWDPDYNSKHDE